MNDRFATGVSMCPFSSLQLAFGKGAIALSDGLTNACAGSSPAYGTKRRCASKDWSREKVHRPSNCGWHQKALQRVPDGGGGNRMRRLGPNRQESGLEVRTPSKPFRTVFAIARRHQPTTRADSQENTAASSAAAELVEVAGIEAWAISSRSTSFGCYGRNAC